MTNEEQIEWTRDRQAQMLTNLRRLVREKEDELPIRRLVRNDLRFTKKDYGRFLRRMERWVELEDKLDDLYLALVQNKGTQNREEDILELLREMNKMRDFEEIL